MTRKREARTLLRWYPRTWRERYGDEFVAFVEDCSGEEPIARSLQRSIVLAGLRERCYVSGLIGSRSTLETQRRTGSLIVLVAWAMMVIGGASLAKSAEHFSNALPSVSRSPAQSAYDLVVISALVGSALVVVGAGVAVPAFVRLLRTGGWTQVRRVFFDLALMVVLLALSTFGLSAWAHHLTSTQRNGGNLLYVVAFLIYALVVVLSVAAATRVAVVVATNLDLSTKVLRTEGYLALGVGSMTLAMVASTVLWWVQMAHQAPWFLQGTVVGVSVTPWSSSLLVTPSTPMLITSGIMLVATVCALLGASRVAVSFRRAK